MPDNHRKNETPMPTIIGRKDILLLGAAVTLFTALLVWMLFGTIRTSFTEVGILTTQEDAEMIHQPEQGVVTELLVSQNSYVHEGEELVRVISYETIAAENAETLEEMQSHATGICSPVSGYVSDINVTTWEPVDLSTTLMMVSEAPTRQIGNALAYISLESIDQVEIGTEVKIELEGMGSRYGTLSGRVTKIGQLPVSLFDVITRTGSQRTAELLYKEGTEQFLVEIALDKDAGGVPLTAGRDLPSSAFVTNKICRLTFYSDTIHPYQILIQDFD